ncbi:hypothetical protein HK105_200478 [Polyrhizophydium stewartii]|uniref:Uncharacterized protein n=1 Tax=Polyrhizophydium stewartii TaxID=2732419 RepID=A0ABR4NJ54_9FUNG
MLGTLVQLARLPTNTYTTLVRGACVAMVVFTLCEALREGGLDDAGEYLAVVHVRGLANEANVALFALAGLEFLKALAPFMGIAPQRALAAAQVAVAVGIAALAAGVHVPRLDNRLAHELVNAADAALSAADFVFQVILARFAVVGPLRASPPRVRLGFAALLAAGFAAYALGQLPMLLGIAGVGAYVPSFVLNTACNLFELASIHTLLLLRAALAAAPRRPAACEESGDDAAAADRAADRAARAAAHGEAAPLLGAAAAAAAAANTPSCRSSATLADTAGPPAPAPPLSPALSAASGGSDRTAAAQ